MKIGRSIRCGASGAHGIDAALRAVRNIDALDLAVDALLDVLQRRALRRPPIGGVVPEADRVDGQALGGHAHAQEALIALDRLGRENLQIVQAEPLMREQQIEAEEEAAVENS